MPIAPPAAPTPEPQPLRAPYRPPSGGWDEMVAADGSVRPHWRSVAPLLSASAASQLNSRAAAVRRLLQDHGVTYNVYDDALGTSRPWELDLIPHIVDEAEFRQVARGLNQRARLLEAILSDLYGSQRLLRENLLPPALVYACPGFLRSSVGTSPAGGRFLNLYACDLARDPQGLWRVMADRTQTPSALGYALENRTIIRQVMAGEFQRAQVQRLAGYYDRLRLTLQHLSPQGRLGEAGILMLTPGPRDATYFEHAFLARQLGFPLVEGADLTVRDRRVWLKTLEGLKRVDVVLRFLEDEWCDPLELRSSSHLGTPGLAEAWRSGSVSLANGLGTGLVETPALHPFLPALSRALLDEELLLPGVVTWWCGQPQELKAVLDQPARWVLKPAFVRGARDPLFLADLSREELTAALSQLRARPQDWIAQERLNFSTTPSLTSAGTVEPRPLVWRTLLSATQRGDYETLPG
ncbi:MAG: circularly permuted type 2 ATP-grasp protein, partial [Verrucomicrobiales bacterium]|nr:circularly permuted type 2 ATP-grasp protein [Verrucomicrobiales bacterium]